MNLTLTVKASQADAGFAGALPLHHRFDKAGGTVGRDPTCDFVLPDTRNIVSGRHMTLSFMDGQFSATDTSRNGVFVNGSRAPLGLGTSCSLADGDTVRIGDYEFAVAVDAGLGSAVPGGLFAAGSPSPGMDRAMSRGIVDFGPSVASDADPLSHLAPASPAPAATPVSAMRALPRFGVDDDLAGLFEGPAEADAMPLGAPFPLSAPLPSPSPPAVSSAPVPIQAMPAFPAPLPIPPAASSSPVGLIPDDWMPDFAAPQARPAVPQSVPPQPSPPSPPPPDVNSTALLLQRREAARDGVPGAPPQATPPGEDAKLLAAFWGALGVDPANLSVDERARLLRQVGASFREMADGLIGVLAMRGTIKSEFRMERTMVGSTENNLFKFTRSADELLSMASMPSKAYMPLDSAVRGAFADIRAHEVATLSAVQLSIRSLLDRFDPQRIEQQTKEKRRGFSLGSAKAAFWEFFTGSYNELASDADEASNRIFATELARAYRERTQRTDA